MEGEQLYKMEQVVVALLAWRQGLPEENPDQGHGSRQESCARGNR